MSKDYTSHNERVEFFTKFIAKIILYNDRLIIIYNTRPNDSEEIIINGKEDIEKIETAIAKNAEKKSFSVNYAERLDFGGEEGIRTLAPCYRPNPLAGGPLNHLGTSPIFIT